MIEIIVSNDTNDTERLFCNHSLEYSGECLCVKAVSKNEVLGFCLFEILGNTVVIHHIEPNDDVMLSDGILRSALHIADERGVFEAYYKKTVSEELLVKLNFIENHEKRQLKFRNLFEKCQNCSRT